MEDNPDNKAITTISTEGSASSSKTQRNVSGAIESDTSDPELNDQAPWIFSGTITKKDKHQAYKKTATIVENYSDEMIKKWNEEINNLLVFAALYSGILTAFNVQSYPYLQPPAPDATLAVLQQMSLQLNSFTTSPPFTNSTVAYIAPDATAVQTPIIPLWIVTLNILWFWALIIGLAVAYFALMVQQWLHEYQDRCTGTSQEYARLRQYRLNNLIEWHVSWIVVTLPLLLQVSLSLFFAGLLVLLWHFNSIVAAFASALVGVVMFTILLLTILPAIWSHCSFLSPPGNILLYALQWTEYVVKGASVRLGSLVVWGATIISLYNETVADRSHALAGWWMEWKKHVSDAHIHIFTTRHHEELATAHNSSSKLDVDMIIDGYHTTMSLDDASTLVPILIDQTPDEVDRCFTRLFDISSRHHASSERERDFSTELRRPFKHGWSSHLKTFGHLTLQQRQTVIFMLSATVMAHGAGTILALNDLADIFHDNSDACQEMEWHNLKHVATAVVKLTERHLAGQVVIEISKARSLLDRAFGLFRWVWVHRRDARDHQSFYRLALRMAGHLNQSLVKPHYDEFELTKSVLEYLTETLEILSHDHLGPKLADELHAEITATTKDMSSEFKLKFKDELDRLKKKLEILGAGKNNSKDAGKQWNKLLCQLHLQVHTIGFCTCQCAIARDSTLNVHNSPAMA